MQSGQVGQPYHFIIQPYMVTGDASGSMIIPFAHYAGEEGLECDLSIYQTHVFFI